MDGYASTELEEEDGPAFTKGMIRQLRIKINEINNEENCRNILLSGVVATSMYATRDDNAAKGQ